MYDMSRFSTQSFERFVQALAASILGPRLQVFGVGRDGAREATYEGHCRITDQEWNGYLVIQAKYHAEPETPAKNAEWLKKQISDEMLKYQDTQRDLRRPDFYLLASNVRLSASAADRSGRGGGGIDSVTEHLQTWGRTLGFKGVHLWHADTLGSFLDGCEEIRTSFGFWVQPSDVLAMLLRRLGDPHHEDTLFRFLRNGLRQSRDIKTRDAGQTTGRTLALDDIFMDLPIKQQKFVHHVEIRKIGGIDHDGIDASISRDADNFEFVPDGHPTTSRERPRILKSIMLRASDKFGTDGLQESSEGKRKEPLRNRIVLLGGPGQGKSTVGQYLAQVCRARLLDSARTAQSPETNSAVRAIIARAVAEKIPVGGPLRYPIHVELPRYADALSEFYGKRKWLDGLKLRGQTNLQGSRRGHQRIRTSSLALQNPLDCHS